MRRNRNGRSHADDEGRFDDDGDQNRQAFDGSSPLQSQALGDALGAYNFAPLSTPVSEAVEREARDVSRRTDPRNVAVDSPSNPISHPTSSSAEEPAMAANPLYYVDLSQAGDALNDPALDDALTDGAVVDLVALPIEVPEHAIALVRNPGAEPDRQQDVVAKRSMADLVEQLAATRSAIGAAFEFCATSADQMDASAATFVATASGLRAAGAEQLRIQAMMSDAIHQIESINDEIDREREAALAEQLEMLDRAERETEQLRAAALADVDRARNRLLQFTNEFSTVASELQGALATDRVANGRD